DGVERRVGRVVRGEPHAGSRNRPRHDRAKFRDRAEDRLAPRHGASDSAADAVGVVLEAAGRRVESDLRISEDHQADQESAARAEAQRKTADAFKVPYDFQFTDHVKESGITFVDHVVDDAALYYKPVHYDHGTGIAAADVDGDGLIDLYFVNQVGGSQLYKNL